MNKAGDFNDNIKDVFHYPKENENRYERRTTSAIDSFGNLWGCISFENKGQSRIELQAAGPDGKRIFGQIIRACNNPSAPFLFARDDGGISAVWIELTANCWRVMYAEKECLKQDFSIQVVHSSPNACLHPTLCMNGGKPFIAWAEYDEDSKRFAIFSARFDHPKWSAPFMHVHSGAQCFRPAVCSHQDRLFMAWDEGADGEQYIVVRELGTGEQTPDCHDYVIKRESERLIMPSIVIDKSSVCSLACISVKDIMDGELGISDHKTGVAFARISGRNLSLDKSLAADLNEGLLGHNVYVPYFGIRRKCRLSKGKDGDIWLTWEMRFENEREDRLVQDKNKFSDEHYGYLIGKRLDQEGVWHEPVIIHEGGTCYSFAGINNESQFAFAYLQQSNVYALPALQLESIDHDQPGKLETDETGYGRWDKLQYRVKRLDRYETAVDEVKLGLYWADTHVHSNLSPDAEGEPDELILYGRDIAGLDAMSMVDNDYYPHAGLMPMEWENQMARAKAYTQPGSFVVFPGYEFTYHDPSINPNFNHRYVIYPQKGKYFSRLNPQSRSLKSLVKEIEMSDAIMVAHHPTWELSGHPIDQFVEICSSWRISFEEKDFVKDHLLRGQEFAFIGSSDTHRACPGLGGALTGIYAEELEPNCLFDAYKKRRTIVTQGLRIAIDFCVDNLFIGDSGRTNKYPGIRLKVISPVDLEFVEVYRDDLVIRRYEPCGKICAADFSDHEIDPGRHFYYVRVKAIGDPSFNENDSNKKKYAAPLSDMGDIRSILPGLRGRLPGARQSGWKRSNCEVFELT